MGSSVGTVGTIPTLGASQNSSSSAPTGIQSLGASSLTSSNSNNVDMSKIMTGRVATKIFGRLIFGAAVKNVLKVGNLYQSCTTLGLDQVSSCPPQTKEQM